MNTAFTQLGIFKPILQAIEAEGFESPTEIQEKTIPLILQGKDIIASSSTGSGKTLAFSCGFIQKSNVRDGVQALILCPTRELAEQVSDNIKLFARYTKLRTACVYGGVPINKQFSQIKVAEIVVGTPGRILDHLKRRTLDLSHVKTIVLDEADRMLDMGFVDDVERIMSKCPSPRQTLFFTATLSREINTLARKHLSSPEKIEAES